MFRKMLQNAILAAGLLGGLALFSTASAVGQTTINVNSTCTLSNAIASANAGAAMDGCTLSGGAPYTIQLQNQTYTMGFDNYWYGANALPPIASNITIEGNGATLAITDSTVASLGIASLRFFYAGADPNAAATLNFHTPGAGNLTLRNLTLTGGRQKGGGSYYGGAGAGMGGAIFNQGSLALEGVTLNGNSATGGSPLSLHFYAGGGMGGNEAWFSFETNPNAGGGEGFATGDILYTSLNGGGTADGLGGSSGVGASGGHGSGGGGYGSRGGGFFGSSGGSGGFGGGGGSSGSSGGGFGGGSGGNGIGGGGAGMGGAIFNHQGTLTVTNSTFTANTATGGTGANPGSGLGGAIFNLNGRVALRFSTLAGNTGGGAIYSLGYNLQSQTASLTISNSILSNTIGGNDLVSDKPGTVASGAANVATSTLTYQDVNIVMSSNTGRPAPAVHRH